MRFDGNTDARDERLVPARALDAVYCVWIDLM